MRVRPIRPDDASLLTDFHARQSPQSIYYRYFSPRPRLTERDVAHLVEVDYVDRMALIALRADELIGVARYDRWRHRAEAEVAFFVDDANHGRGLATVLLEHLAVRASGEILLFGALQTERVKSGTHVERFAPKAVTTPMNDARTRRYHSRLNPSLEPSFWN